MTFKLKKMNKKMIGIHLASDHAGFDLKTFIQAGLKNEHIGRIHTIFDHGTFSKDSVDYPDFIHRACNSIKNIDLDIGIFICGSGNGVAMTANKYPHIRAALCWTPQIARFARQHNDANVLCLPARFITFDEALEIVKEFLVTSFEGGRHEIRVKKIPIST